MKWLNKSLTHFYFRDYEYVQKCSTVDGRANRFRFPCIHTISITSSMSANHNDEALVESRLVPVSSNHANILSLFPDWSDPGQSNNGCCC